MSHLFRKTALRSNIQRAMFSLSLVGVLPVMAVTAPAWAQSASQEQDYEIAAGPLGTALSQFAAASGVTLSFGSAQTEGRHTQGIHGRYSFAHGIAQLLAGSGLQVQREGEGRYSLIAVPQTGALELGPTSIKGAGLGETTENTGSYTTGAVSVGGKTPKALREIPQSVSVLTRQSIEDQGISNVNQALDKLTGVTVVGGNDVDASFYSRGFQVTSIQTDGNAPAVRQQNYQSLADLAIYDHVEILRGSDGLFSGTGEPGGTLNLVRKKPLAYNQFKTTTSAGSWDNYRQELDITGPLGFDGRLRGRAVAAVEDRDYFYDTTSSEKNVFYGVLEADLTPDTLLTFGGSHQWRKIDGYWDSGLPRYNTGDDIGLPRDTSLSADWSSARYETNELFAKLEHSFNERWRGSASYSRYHQDVTQNIGQATGTLDQSTGIGSNFQHWARDYSIDQDLYDANVAGHFDAFGLEHEILFGVDHQETRRSFDSYRLGIRNIPVRPGVSDIADIPQGALPELYITFPAWNQRKTGAYSTLRLKLAEPLTLIAGARYSDYDDNITSVTPGDGMVYPTGGSESGVITPYGGLVYDLNDQWTVYTSYSRIFSPQTNYLDTNYQSLKPMTGDTYELGTKAELFDKRLNLSLAAYYTKRENEYMLVTAQASEGNPCCYEAAGKVVSKGFDAEISGEILTGWQIGAGYTFNLNKQLKTGTASNVGKPLSTQTPKHLFKVFTSYQLPGSWERWKVGAGATIQSRNYVSGTSSVKGDQGQIITTVNPFQYEQAGYAVWNALVDYKVDDHWTLSLNGNNLFDKTYYRSVGTNAFNNWYGEPRNYMLTLRGTF